MTVIPAELLPVAATVTRSHGALSARSLIIPVAATASYGYLLGVRGWPAIPGGRIASTRTGRLGGELAGSIANAPGGDLAVSDSGILAVPGSGRVSRKGVS